MRSDISASDVQRSPGPLVPVGDSLDTVLQEQPKSESDTGKREPLGPDSPWFVYADRLREVIQHENELGNQRLHWLVLLNGLAFTATGVLWGKEDVFPILVALGLAGVVCSLSCYLTLQGGRSALDAVNGAWENSGGPDKVKAGQLAPISARPKVINSAPRLLTTEAWKNDAWIDNRLTRLLHPLNAIPLVVVLVWCVLVANLFSNHFSRRDAATFPVRLTHRGLEIEVKEAEEAPPAPAVRTMDSKAPPTTGTSAIKRDQQKDKDPQPAPVGDSDSSPQNGDSSPGIR